MLVIWIKTDGWAAEKWMESYYKASKRWINSWTCKLSKTLTNVVIVKDLLNKLNIKLASFLYMVPELIHQDKK